MFHEHAQVVLTCRLPALDLSPGDLGVVVHKHGLSTAYEVKFISFDGRTIGTATLDAGQLRPVAPGAVLHEQLRASP